MDFIASVREEKGILRVCSYVLVSLPLSLLYKIDWVGGLSLSSFSLDRSAGQPSDV